MASAYENRRRSGKRWISVAEAHELHCEHEVADWVDSLPKPVGLLACNDLRAYQLLMACGEKNIKVPDEVAVIGVDNDDLICELCYPPLSSIELNSRRAGYEAAALLGRMLDGETPPAEPILIEPLGLVPRLSTDLVAVDDADVATALHFIRAHACDGIRVGDILDHVQTSRSTLERRFERLLGRSPKAEILRTQLNHVKYLLLLTGYPLTKIADLSGFRHVASMSCSFKRHTGQTPGQYRSQFRSQESS